MALKHEVWTLMMCKAFIRDSAKQFILFVGLQEKVVCNTKVGYVVKNFISEQRTSNHI